MREVDVFGRRTLENAEGVKSGYLQIG